MKAEDLMKAYTDLEKSVADTYSELLKERQEYRLTSFDAWGLVVHEVSELVESEVLPLIEIRNPTTGSVEDFYLIAVDQNGVKVIDVDSYEERSVEFSDICDVFGRIVVIDEMEHIKQML